MSIASLADEEIIQTEGAITHARLEPNLGDLSERITRSLSLDNVAAATLDKELKSNAGGPSPPPQKPRASSALDALTRFIPTESVTIYIAAVAAMPALQSALGATPKSVYWSCAAMTPILLCLIILGKRKSLKNSLDPSSNEYQNLKVFPGLRKWPWFKLFAATVAFLVWALAVNGSPYFVDPNGKVVAAFGALLVSTFLTLLEPLLSRKAI